MAPTRLFTRPLNTWFWRGSLITLLVAAGAWAGLPSPIAWAATITVNTTTDELNADGDCSLREAIIAANTDAAIDACAAGSGADTILVPAGLYTLSLSGSDDAAALGDLDLKTPITLVGAGMFATAIDADGIDRVFELGPGVSDNPIVTLSRLSVLGGDAGGSAGGGILLYRGNLTLANVRVLNNTNYGVFATGAGSSDTFTLVDSQIENNEGGVYINTDVTALIVRSTIQGNTVTGVDDGAGINNRGTLTLVNSTLSGNETDYDGGGLANSGTATLYSVTIANNQADADGNGNGYGGGIYQTGTLTLRNSLIGDNRLGTAATSTIDCSGTLTTGGYNLLEHGLGCAWSGTGAGDQTGVDPALNALTTYGGPTFTHQLKAGSPAINAGNPAGCVDDVGASLTVDQRGFARDAHCDIGAYEANSAGTPTPTPSLTPTATATASPTATPTAAPTSTGSQYLYLTALHR